MISISCGSYLWSLVQTNLCKEQSFLVRYALEQLPVSFTFGIPGVHNTELYDELAKSGTDQPYSCYS